MKKTITLVLLVVLATSCKKVRTCSCTEVETGPSGTETSSWTYSRKDTKKNAKTWCEGFSTTYSSGSYNYSTTCELK